MEQGKNKNGVNLLLVFIIVILAALCVLFATGTIKLNSKETANESNNQISDNTNVDNTNVDNTSTDLLNSNIIVTQNGKVISNDVPSDLSGKYVNPGSSNNDYFEITNENIIVSRSNCSNGGAVTIEKSQLRLYIDYLDTYREHDKYVTIKLEAIDTKTNEVMGTYVYIGNSSFGGSYKFKTIEPTCTSGEGYFYEKAN